MAKANDAVLTVKRNQVRYRAVLTNWPRSADLHGLRPARRSADPASTVTLATA